jgi:hypothetical protein
MTAHYDGKASEEPNPYPQGYILRAGNKDPLPEAARTTLEYFCLMESLYSQGKIQYQPDAFNVRQLLGTTAISEEPRHG